MQALTPPKELTPAQAQALAALDLRLLGLQQLQSGTSPGAAVATLVASDRIWDSAVRTPANAVLQAKGLGGVFPASTFVAAPKTLAKSLATALGTATTGSTTAGAVLKLGDTGQDVVAWQNALDQWIQASGSSLTPLTADGNFGAGTQAATVALQNAAGLAPDGVVGPSTRQALAAAAPGEQVGRERYVDGCHAEAGRHGPGRRRLADEAEPVAAEDGADADAARDRRQLRPGNADGHGTAADRRRPDAHRRGRRADQPGAGDGARRTAASRGPRARRAPRGGGRGARPGSGSRRPS